MARINSKAKGSDFERKIAKVLSRWWGEEFHRTPMSGGLQWKQDNRVAGDIVTPPDSIYPFTTECKKREEWNFEQVLKGTGDVEKYWQQATKDSEKVSMRPLLIFSKNFAPNYMMIRKSDFEAILCGSNASFNYFLIHKPGCEDRVVCILEDFIADVSKEDVIRGLSLGS